MKPKTCKEPTPKSKRSSMGGGFCIRPHGHVGKHRDSVGVQWKGGRAKKYVRQTK